MVHTGVVLQIALIAVGAVVVMWALLYLLAARLPEGPLKELASVLPDCVTTVRRLRRDERVPRRAKMVVALAGVWLVSPIDLIPEFIPVIGPLDDVIVAALALRYAARRIPSAVIYEAWPGRRSVIERLLGDRLAGTPDAE